MSAIGAAERRDIAIDAVRPIVGMEVHVELSTRTKLLSGSGGAAHPACDGAAPNSLIDPTVLALPGSLPVLNRAAIEDAMLVGLALGCSIAEVTKWDRKGYFYPDLPKAYQISQYDLPLCFDGSIDVPLADADGRIDFSGPATRIGIVRAHLEEDAGKLLHELPAAQAAREGRGQEIVGSIVDLNRAGTPLLEIVTAPSFTAAQQAVTFGRMLRQLCRFLGVTPGVMQEGHMRFEPNINCELTLENGRTVRTPIVEVKNLNSFKALAGAIDYELGVQPERWREDGRELGPGSKSTRGWDDGRGVTVLQREKEDAHDYRYFPDPDLPPVAISSAWRESVAARMPELPLARMRRYVDHHDLSAGDAERLVEERAVCVFYEAAVDAAVEAGLPRDRAGRMAANAVLQTGMRLANERSGERAGDGGAAPLVSDLGIEPGQLGHLLRLRDAGEISSNGAERLFELLCAERYRGRDAASVAEYEGLLTVRDDGALDAWCDQVIAANGAIAEQVRAGKVQAAGRLIGEVMKLSRGQADPKTVRARLLERLGQRDG